jgi:pimeloyl-ACP methyl ester carboxylesterase
MDHRMFNAQVEALLTDYRVLVWDARGHGKSKPLGNRFSLDICVGDLLAILDEIRVDQAVLVGQSLGGYIAQGVYSRAPERVLAMVIIGATPLGKAYGSLEVWMLRATLPLFTIWPYRHLTKVMAQNTARTEEARRYALEACRQVERRDFLAIWKAVTELVDQRGRPGFPVKVPLLLVHGEHDRAGTILRDMPEWAQVEPEATYRVIPGAGHNANQDNPAATNEILLEFLRERVG